MEIEAFVHGLIFSHSEDAFSSNYFGRNANMGPMAFDCPVMEKGPPRLADKPHQVGVDDKRCVSTPLVGLVNLTKQGDGFEGCGQATGEGEQIAAGGRPQLPGHLVQLPSRVVARASASKPLMLRHVDLVPAVAVQQITARAVPQRRRCRA